MKKHFFLAFIIISALSSCSDPVVDIPALNLQSNVSTPMEDPQLIIDKYTVEDLLIPDYQINRLLTDEHYLVLHLQEKSSEKECIQLLDIITLDRTQVFCTDHTITDIALDASGNMYLGTAEAGILKIDPYGNLLSTFTTDNTCMPTNHISALAVDNLRNIYFGIFQETDMALETAHYQGFGLFKINPQGSGCENWTSGNSNIPGDAILDIAIYQDRIFTTTIDKFYRYRNDLNASADQGGLGILEEGAWTIYNTNNSSPLITNLISNLQIVGNGKLWMENINPTDPPQSTLIEIAPSGAITEIRVGSGNTHRQLAVEFENGARVFYGIYPSAESGGLRPFFYREMEGQTEDYSSQLNIHFISMVIDEIGYLWLASDEELWKIGFPD